MWTITRNYFIHNETIHSLTEAMTKANNILIWRQKFYYSMLSCPLTVAIKLYPISCLAYLMDSEDWGWSSRAFSPWTWTPFTSVIHLIPSEFRGQGFQFQITFSWAFFIHPRKKVSSSSFSSIFLIPSMSDIQFLLIFHFELLFDTWECDAEIWRMKYIEFYASFHVQFIVEWNN